MDFNFHDLYSGYSNIELLKIIRQPDNYQHAAIDAATEILYARGVSETDMQEAEELLQQEEAATKVKNDEPDLYKNKVTDFLQDLTEQQTEMKPGKWLTILLLIIGIQYTYTFYKTSKSFMSFLACGDCHFDFIVFLQFVGLVYIPVIFFLLYKRNRWGWILLFADTLFTFLGSIVELIILFKYPNTYRTSAYQFLVPLIIRGLFAFFLWRQEIIDFYGITSDTRKKTLIVTVLGTILFFGCILVVSYNISI